MNVLEFLKTETRDLHIQSEQTVNAESIMDGSLEVQQYTQILLHMYRFHHAVEQAFLPHQTSYKSDHPFYPFITTRYTDLLRKDLAALDQAEPEPLAQSILLDDLAAIGGALYVVEGSMLGGRVIWKALQKNSGLDDCQPFHFYKGNDQETGTRWMQFQRVMKEHIFSLADQKNALLAARKTFQLFIDGAHN